MYLMVFGLTLTGCMTFPLPEVNYYASLETPADEEDIDKFITRFTNETGLVVSSHDKPRVETGSGLFAQARPVAGMVYFAWSGGEVPCNVSPFLRYDIERKNFSFRVPYYREHRIMCVSDMARKGRSLFEDIFGVELHEYTRNSGLFGP